jgi:cysteine desulfurase
MLAKTAIYHLDANAGSPLRSEVLGALQDILKKEGESSFSFGNPSSAHAFGRRSKSRIHEASEQVAASLGLGVRAEDILFTSSGTEANQTAIRSVLESALLESSRPHWITTPVEHDATLQMIDWFKSRGGEVSLLPVDREGRPEVSRLSEFSQVNTRLASVIWVNNETGVITDVKTLARECGRLSIPLHLDGAQAWG